VAACGSPWTLRLVGQLVDQSERYRRARLLAAGLRGALARNVDAEHRAITEAALARDSTKRAARLPAAHLAHTADLVAALWSAKAGAGARTRRGRPDRSGRRGR
jgi:GntR family transcriptional regulator, carbon starvation induced regulator